METNLFDKTIELIKAYQQKSNLSDKHNRTVDEIIARLNSASQQYALLVDANTTFLKEDSQQIAMREMMSEENINKLMAEQSKKDPKLAEYLSSVGGKLVKKQSTEISAFDITKLDTKTHKYAQKIKDLHSNTESIYNNLWLIKQRLNQLPKFKNFNPAGVRNVRNLLMTHTEKPNSEAYIYSFGFATRGPVLRPIKPAGVKAPTDSGLETNVKEFLLSMVKVLD